MPKISDKELNMAFNMPPEDIINFFKDKGLKPSFDWHEVYADAHAKAFTVAKMTELDLLKDTKKLLEKTLEDGKSYSEFKREATNLFESKGWTGFKKVTDPKTGEEKTVELGTPRRIKKIYYTNMQSAYAVGRYKEMLEEIDVAPYWQRIAILDEKTRPEHKAMHGKVYRADDPIWVIFYPPDAWGCRCFVRCLTRAEVERMGIKVESSEGCISSVQVKVGDEIKEIPVFKFNDGGIERVLKPDAGWETNLGIKAWGIDVQAWNKVKDMPEKIKFNFIAKIASNPHRESSYINWATQIFNGELVKTEAEKTLTWLSPNLYQKIKNDIDLESPIIVIQKKQIGHSGKNKVDKQALTEAEYLQIYNIINNYDEVYWDYTRPKWKQIAFIKLLGEGKCIKICVRFNQSSKNKNIDYLVSRITTIGKVNYYNISHGKNFKKIE